MPIEFVQPDPVNLTVVQRGPVEDSIATAQRPGVIETSTGGAQGIPGDDAQWTQITQAAYDALDTPDPNTLYVVIG